MLSVSAPKSTTSDTSKHHPVNTSLLNPPQRGQFLQLLDRDLTKCRLTGSLTGLLVIRLSGLGRINTELGYSIGDTVLVNAVEHIREVVRSEDLLLRIDGVDFALIMPSLRSAGQIMLAARKIANACAQSMQVQDRPLSVSARIGGALAPEHAESAESLLRCADMALLAAERSADYMCVFASSENNTVQDTLTLQGDLEMALDNNDLQIYFQPKIDLQQNNVVGVEALSRWQHSAHGFVRPDLFVALAERCGLIMPLTQWSMNTSFRLQQARFPELSVAVNLSAAVLNQVEIAELVDQAVAIWGIEAEQLVLEVTESAMMADPVRTLDTLHRLDQQGVKLSIDDFGTGYSSLAYLRDLPVNELKIDRSFVANMTENRQDAKIVQAVIDLAHNLEMSVVAEGIEDMRTLEALRDMGCDVGQGFFIGKPMPVEELSEWLRRSRWSFQDNSRLGNQNVHSLHPGT